MRRYLFIVEATLFLVLSAVYSSSAEGIANFSASGEPVTISASILTFDPDTRMYIAEGSVEIVQGRRILTSDRAILSKDTGEAKAEGHVIFMEDGDMILCDTLEIDLNTRRGLIKNGKVFLKKGNFHLYGEEIEKTGNEDYRIKRGRFTTCDGESPSWSFNASTAEVTVGEYLTSWNTSYQIKGIPVLYLPYLIMPVKNERQSGLLIPRIGYSDQKGIEIDNSFFWAISKNTDATISLNYMSLKGVEEGLEYRYVLNKNTQGTIQTSYIRETDTGNDRWTLKYWHEQYFSPTFFNKTNINYISDNQYYRTYGDIVEERSLNTLESYASFTKNWQGYSIVSQFKYFKDLTDNQEATLQRLPEILFTGLRQPIDSSPFYLSINASAVNLYRETGEKGQRIDLNPRFSTNISPNGYFTFTPELGLRETAYLTNADERWKSREMYDIRGSLSTTLLKVYNFEGQELRKLRHSIEPEIIYEYIPDIDQNNLPLFDPVDRIDKKNLLTYSLTNRVAGKIYSSESDYYVREFIFLKISQGFDVNEARRELLPGSNRRPFTDITAQLRVTPGPHISLFSDVVVGTYDGYMKVINSSAVVSDNRGDSLTMDYRFTKDSLEYVRGNLSVKASDSLNVSYDSRYSLSEARYLENIYTIDYHPQCWSVQFIFSERPEERKYLTVINLTGIGTVGKIQGGTQY